MADRAFTVMVLGGGFGGIRAARRLAAVPGISVLLLTDHPDVRFYPALYQAAVGHSHLGASLPIQTLFVDLPTVTVNIERATHIDLAKQTVVSQTHRYQYDAAIIALGSVTNYFGIPGLEQFAYGVKSLDEAERFRRHLHDALLDDAHPERNVVIVGGGPTGVELAGALPGAIERIIRCHHLTGRTVSIDLVEAADRLLPGLPAGLSSAVAARLKTLGVHIYPKTPVKGETPDRLMLPMSSLASRTVVWTAGVATNPFFAANPGFQFDRRGKVIVDEHLAAAANVYVIGDNAATPYSGLAQTAVTDADFVADTIVRLRHHQPLKPYRPRQPISIIPVGSSWAAVSWGQHWFSGWLGWLLRRGADFLAYNDLESLPEAWRSWWADEQLESDCSLCSAT